MKVDWYYLIMAMLLGSFFAYTLLRPKKKKGLPLGSTREWPKLPSSKDTSI